MTLDTSRTILVVGATGTVGGAVARELVAAGARVRALVRSDDAAARLPAGVVPVRGDLRDPLSLQLAVAGAYAAFYVSPDAADQEPMADAFVRACTVMDTRIVFAGHDVGGETPVRRTLRRAIVAGALSPHDLPALRVAERIHRSDARPVLLVPTDYFQNDEAVLDEILDGRFVLQFRARNRVDVRDVARAAVRALLEPGFASGVYPVVGPDTVSSADCAAAWSRALRRPVADASMDRAAAARHGRHRQEPTAVLAYDGFGRRRAGASVRAVEATTELLGRAPATYDAYVREVAASLSLRSG